MQTVFAAVIKQFLCINGNLRNGFRSILRCHHNNLITVTQLF